MYKGKKHIAFSLLLVFFSLIVYQPIHIIGHHSHKHNCSSGFCKVTEPGHLVFQNDEHCFICDYEFTINGLPEEFNTPFIESCFYELKPDKMQVMFLGEIIIHTSPRAPPFLS